MHSTLSAARIWQLVALALAVAASLIVLFAPLYSSSASNCTPGVACATAPVAPASALAVNGPALLGPMLIPVLFTLVPLLVRSRAWRPASIVCAVLLGMTVLVALLTIGMFYLPALIASIIGVSLRAPRAAAA